jgi:hypothetical protein
VIFRIYEDTLYSTYADGCKDLLNVSSDGPPPLSGPLSATFPPILELLKHTIIKYFNVFKLTNRNNML